MPTHTQELPLESQRWNFKYDTGTSTFSVKSIDYNLNYNILRAKD